MNKLLRMLLPMIAAFGFESSAFGQGIAITPANPNETDWITVRFLGGSAVDSPDSPICAHADGVYRKVSVSNNVIRIEKFDENPIIFPGGTPPIPVPAHDVWAGRLMAGNYRVELHCTVNTGISFLYATGNVSVASSYLTRAERMNPASFPPRPLVNYSGHWTPRDELGWGLVIQQVDSRQLAVTVFTYASDKRPVWYFCGGGQWDTVFIHRASCSRFQAEGFGTPIQSLVETGTGSVVLRFAQNPLGVPGEDRIGYSLPEDFLVADIAAEGRTVLSSSFIRIR